MKIMTVCVLACSVGATAGCATAPVLKVKDFGDDKIAYYTAEGGVVMKGKEHGICVMPPAQGVREISSKGNLKIDAKNAQSLSASLDASGEQNHAVESLFSRSQGDLYLETMMYRLCEMHANGFFKPGDTWSQNTYKTLVLEVMKESAAILLAEAALEKQKTATAVASATADAAKVAAAASSPAATPEEKKSADAKLKFFQDNLDTLRPLLAPSSDSSPLR